MTKTRVLPPAEWQRLEAIEPFVKAQTLPDPRFAVVLVEEETETGAIVGCWMVTSIMLLEGLWRREDYRKQFSAKRLLFGMLDFLRSQQIKTAITCIEDPEVAALARKIGFDALPGAVHVITLKEGT